MIEVRSDMLNEVRPERFEFNAPFLKASNALVLGLNKKDLPETGTTIIFNVQPHEIDLYRKDGNDFNIMAYERDANTSRTREVGLLLSEPIGRIALHRCLEPGKLEIWQLEQDDQKRPDFKEPGRLDELLEVIAKLAAQTQYEATHPKV